jgi:putative FmdB family regulatory protein
MPIYEFVCEDCEHEFETLVRNRDEVSNLRCPKCRSPRLKRLMSVAAAIVSDGGSAKPTIETHKCESGTCATLNLPGHSR